MPKPEGLLDRLTTAPQPGETWDVLVLAALEGPEQLETALDSSHPDEAPQPATAPAASAAPRPRPAYLSSITVEGFRGIGKSTTLDLHPGPGLTLVVGRNGSGKSSFAEALELLLTGNTWRFKQRSKVWEKGWRSLHHKPAAIEAQLHIEGETAPATAARRWEDEADLPQGVTTFQVKGKPRTDLASLGWSRPLETYRPFLSYNELGSMLDEGPSKLYDALSSILGLEELTEAQSVLAEARKTREKAYKEVGEKRAEILDILEKMEDDRARAFKEVLQRKDWGLDEADALLAKATAGTAADADLAFLHQIATLQPPAQETVTAVVKELREAHHRQQAAAQTLSARSQQLAEILDLTLRFHEKHGDADCPVCGRPKALDKDWHQHKQQEARELKEAAKEATAATQQADQARKKAQSLHLRHPEGAQRPRDLPFPVDPLFRSLSSWNDALMSPSLESLATHLESSYAEVSVAIEKARTAAQSELTTREDRWRPVAPVLAAWLAEAKQARSHYDSVKPLKTAEAGSSRTSPSNAPTASSPSRRRRRPSGTSSACKATWPSTTSASPAPPPSARSSWTSRWTASRAQPSAS